MRRARLEEEAESPPRQRPRRTRPAARAGPAHAPDVAAPVRPDGEPAHWGAHPDARPGAFRHWLLSRYAKGVLTATDVASAAFSLGPAGALAAGVHDLALPPRAASGQRQGGHAERQISQALGQEEFLRDEVFCCPVPMHAKRTASRNAGFMQPFVLPHEAIARLRDSPNGLAHFQVQDESIFNILRIARHPVVMERGSATVLLRLYADAVPYHGRARASPDSVICFTWSPVTGTTTAPRFLITAVRKQDLCRSCGCGGRCSVDEILRVINWSLSHAQRGVWPEIGPRGEPLDAARSQRARQPLGYHAALVELGADWAELGHTFGFRAWNSTFGPCPKCTRTSANLYDHASNIPARRHATYLNAAAAGEVVADVSAEDAASLQAALAPDMRGARGARGRAVTAAVGPFRVGDRLQVAGAIGDVMDDVSQLPNYPARISMWRQPRDSFINAPCPLLAAGGCLTLECVVVDLLHTADSGVAQYWAGAAFSLLLQHNVYGVPPGPDSLVLSRGAAALDRRLRTWYNEPAQAHASQIDFVTVGILLGAQGLARPCSKGKALESRFLFRFALQELSVHLDRLQAVGPAVGFQARLLADSGAHLATVYRVLKEHGPRLPPVACSELLQSAALHCTYYQAAGFRPAPKHHWLWEMAKWARFSGNPRFYATYVDEDFNQVVAAVARTAHPSTFARSILKKLRVLRLCRDASLPGMP